ncbi:MAG: NAD(P)-dependent dehydrogenase (short-subunit alcohol dehydrogenase family), partial [Cognaticolwellia sp.]
RNSSPELDALGVQVQVGLDVADADSIEGLLESLNGVKLDWLLNNAGTMERTFLGNMNFESAMRQFTVNALGPLRVTEAMLPQLKAGSKVGIVTSRMGSISDNTSGGQYGYRMSKAAVNAAGVSLARDLLPQKIAVALLHPGYVQTDMTDRRGNVSPAASAKGLIERMDALTLEKSGSFWHADGQELPW